MKKDFFLTPVVQSIPLERITGMFPKAFKQIFPISAIIICHVLDRLLALPKTCKNI